MLSAPAPSSSPKSTDSSHRRRPMPTPRSAGRPSPHQRRGFGHFGHKLPNQGRTHFESLYGSTGLVHRTSQGERHLAQRLIILACSLLIGACGRSQPYVSSAWDFSAAFPASPVEETLEAPTPAGPLTGRHIHSLAKSVGDSAFGVVVLVPPAGNAKLASLDTARDLLTERGEVAARQGMGQVVRQGPIRSGGIEGYELVIEAGRGRARFVAYVHRGRIYEVSGIGDRSRAAEMDSFVDSFRLR